MILSPLEQFTIIPVYLISNISINLILILFIIFIFLFMKSFILEKHIGWW
jgi:hypothetical protein